MITYLYLVCPINKGSKIGEGVPRGGKEEISDVQHSWLQDGSSAARWYTIEQKIQKD